MKDAVLALLRRRVTQSRQSASLVGLAFAIADRVAGSLGLEIVEIEFRGGAGKQGRILRVYIDKQVRHGGHELAGANVSASDGTAAGTVLVSDLAMPDKSGYWLIGQVRALPPDRGGATPAAALTGFTGPEHRANILRAGFQYHLEKPVAIEKLVGVVALLALKAPSPWEG